MGERSTPINTRGSYLSAPYAESDNSAPAIKHRLNLAERLRRLSKFEKAPRPGGKGLLALLSMANVALRFTAIRPAGEAPPRRQPRAPQIPTRWKHVVRNTLRRPILPW